MRWVLYAIAGVLLLLVVTAGGVVVGLNTGAGRAFAVREINRLAGPSLRIEGLGGHFPEDIELRSLQLADKEGIWLEATDADLRWQPLQLLHRDVAVSALTAETIDIRRAPVAGKASKSSGGLPDWRFELDRLEIGALRVAPSLAGEAVALHVEASAKFVTLARGGAVLHAATPDGLAHYDLDAAFDHETARLVLQLAEPPGGLIGHFAGPRIRGPLSASVSLAGPRDNAALDFVASSGAVRLNGTGSLGLVPGHAFADVTLTTPDLAPFGAIAKTEIAGDAQINLHVAQASRNGATLALAGYAQVQNAPARLRAFLDGKDMVNLQAALRQGVVTISTLHAAGNDFALDVTGKASKEGMALAAKAQIDQVAALSPDISGNLAASAKITGPLHDFAVQGQLTGAIRAKEQESGPFTIAMNVQHLPGAATGTLMGTGMVEAAPLTLDAAFSRMAGGAVQVHVAKAAWRSASVTANLHLVPGAVLPTGEAAFSVGRLQDFAPFAPARLQGAASGDFAYVGGQTVKLNLAAKNLVVVPSLGAINGSVAASGPVQALGIKAQLALARLLGDPARLGFAGVLDVQGRSAHVASLTGTWRGLTAALAGPADVTTRPVISVRHLNLALAGGSVTLDGEVAPQLDATMAVKALPANLVNRFVPGLGAAGTVTASAKLTGPVSAPSGNIVLQAAGLHVARGAGAALAPADVTARAQLLGNAANLNVALQAGPDISLALQGQAPLRLSGNMNVAAQGRVDLRLLDLFLAEQGTDVRGMLRCGLRLTGTPLHPQAAGSISLQHGSVENIGSGLNLTGMNGTVLAQGRRVVLQNFAATAGRGTISAQGTAGLDDAMPIDMTLKAADASLIASDLVTETLNADLTLSGALRGRLALAGDVDISEADINIPRGLPPSVANLPILNAGETPPPPPAPPPPIALNVDVRAKNQIFVRGDGLFAELGGHLHIGGTAAAPDPEGHFDLVRGNFALAGKSLQFTQGNIGFVGNGFVPALDLVATASSAEVSDATLTVGGTAAKPVITLSSTPPLPSDEILAQLLFGESASSLTPFQAASLAAALAQISGIGGGLGNPLDTVRSALGLDELSLGGTGTGPPTLQAGRYVAPGVYVGATQATNGQGTQVNVQVNLYKGLTLQTATGTSSAGSNSDSVGLTYQFNY